MINIDSNINIMFNEMKNKHEWYLPRLEYSYKKEYHILNEKIHNLILDSHYEDIHFLCSWFNYYDAYLTDLGYTCYFYDFDEIVCYYNSLITDNVHNVDVIFDDITINGLIVHKYCNLTYPIGKIFSGDMILCSNNRNKLWYASNHNSIDDLILENNIKTIYFKDTIQFNEYEEFIVFGSTI